MIIHNVVQGTPEWLALRKNHKCSSDASTIMGANKHKARNDLLKEKHTGIEPEHSEFTQSLFAKGHATEALARPIVEKMIGETLYPVTASSDDLLASYDGLTLAGLTAFEHKLWNEKLVAQINARELDPHYYWQLEQQILVGGLDRVIFVCSDGTSDKFSHMEYKAVPGRAEALMAGWSQFDTDLAEYVPPEATPLPPVATEVQALPTLLIQAKGEITATNLPEFREQIKAFVGGLNMKPTTDQEFVDGKVISKKLRECAANMKQRKVDMLAQTVTIGQVVSDVDSLIKLVSETALALEKEVEREESRRRERLVMSAIGELSAYLASLNTRLGKPFMPAVNGKFAEAIKGKSKLDSMVNGIATEMARCKIEANEIADRIQINMKAVPADYEFLFSDMPGIVLKQADDFALLVNARIGDHKKAEAVKEEQTRERIRAEEQAKAQREAAQKAAAQQVSEVVTPGLSDEGMVLPPPALKPVVAAAPYSYIAPAGTAKLRALIDDAMYDMTAGEMQQLLDAARDIRASRKQSVAA